MTADADLRYAYGVTGAQHPAARAGLSIEGIGEIESVVVGPLAALVSSVSRGEFSADALTGRLEDLAWVERLARRHFAVAVEAFARGPVLPMRMCTVFASRGRVEEMLAARRDDLVAALDAVHESSEWSVKVLAAPRREVEPAPTGDPSSGSGVAYLSAVRERREVRRARSDAVGEAVAGIDRRLREFATQTVLLPAQPRELAGRDRGGMVLNAAYLVPGRHAASFATAVEAARRELEAGDLRLQVDGPWPPYSFVPELDES